ncbi:MAG: histidinol-phosphate transaminase [Candidatus Cloacimonetes bacterium]|nr:histidinol-phosphate transaminase [Candidatus Cloacimonadota bacterium]
MQNHLVPKHHLTIEPYKPGKPLEEIKREFGLSGFAKLASNENTLGPSPLAMEAMKQALSETHWYPDPNSMRLKEALSQFHGLDKTYFHLGNGTEEILTHVARCFLQAKEEVVLSAHTFPIYTILNRFQNAKEVVVSLKDFRYDLVKIRESITEKTRLVWLCNPNNPTGTWFTAKELSDFFKKLEHKPVVVLDEAYYEYAADSDDFPIAQDLLFEYKNLIITRTFSKAYGLAGIRIGYSMQNPEITEHLNRIRLPFHINNVAQAAACAALEDKPFLKQVQATVRDGKNYLIPLLGSLGFKVHPSLANFLFVTGPFDFSSIYTELLKAGVAIRPITIHKPADAARITVGTASENTMLMKELKSVLKGLERFQDSGCAE